MTAGAASLEKVHAQLSRYEHHLVEFSARLAPNGSVELILRIKNASAHIHTYSAPVHERDLNHPQFPWTFQKFLYDCLHDYLVELFIRTPQSRS